MTFEALLAVLRERNVYVWVDGGRLNYRAAPGAMTAELLESLRHHKTSLVGLLDEAKRAELIEASLRRIPRNADLPLSFAQELLWYLEKLGAGSAAYNIPVALRLDGALDAQALRRALELIVRRHEVLRTTFAVRGRRPMQSIQPPLALDLPIVDLSHMPEELRKPEIARLCAEDARIRFDLSRDLMLRAKLFRMGPLQHVLFLNVHHIAADGWSLGVMYRDLGAFYDANCKAQAPTLDELPVQFADFGAWQREAMRDEMLDGHIAYWKARLAGAPELLLLPTDRPRPATQTLRIPTKPAMHSNMKPATYSDLKPASVPI